MNRPLMPKATAVWLSLYTHLTVQQIADFCGLHVLEIQLLVQNKSTQPLDPISGGQLTLEEINRCEKDSEASLALASQDDFVSKRKKRYIPLSKRQDIPNVVLWMVRNHPEISDAKICSFLATTKQTVSSIRAGTYARMKLLTPKDPVALGLYSKEELEFFRSS